MRVVISNVNTSASITEAIRQQAISYAAPHTMIEVVTPFFGPDAVEDDFTSILSAVAVMDRIMAVKEPYDAVIEAGFGEGSRPGLQDLVQVPVISITDAAAITASLIGRSFSVITTVNRAAAQIEEKLLLSGLIKRCASIRPTGLRVLDIENDYDAATTAIVEESKRALSIDNAEVICLGCAAMVTLENPVSAAVMAPVVEGVSAAVKLVEGLHSLRLGATAVRNTRHEHPGLTFWPLHRYLPGIAERNDSTPKASEPFA
jgi:allantoin racemase